MLLIWGIYQQQPASIKFYWSYLKVQHMTFFSQRAAERMANASVFLRTVQSHRERSACEEYII